MLADMNIRAPTSQTGLVGDILSRRYGFIVFAGAAVCWWLLRRALSVGRHAGEHEVPAPPSYREVG